MKTLKLASICLAVTLTIPFFTNLLGWNLYLYTALGNSDFIIAPSQGVCHLAVADHQDEMLTGLDLGLISSLEGFRVDTGPFVLFSEKRLDPMTPFTFSLSPVDPYLNYRAIEFPWLALLILPVIIYYIASKRPALHNNSQQNNPRYAAS